LQWKPLNTTSGSAEFFVDASIEKLEFALFSNGTSYPIELASSSTLHMLDAHAPKHIRLARTQLRDEMRVSWSLSSLDRSAGARIEWGIESGKYTQFTLGSPSTYTKADLCGPPATTHGFLPTPIFYSGIITGLPKPGFQVFYRVGSDSAGWSQEVSFTSPTGGDKDATLRVTAIADMGERYL